MSLTSVKAGQFMGRSGSFSTHGNKRGFSDLGEASGDEILNNPLEKRAVLSRRVGNLMRKTGKTHEDNILQAELQLKLIELRPEVVEYQRRLEAVRSMQFGHFLKTVCRERLSESEYMSIVKEAGRRADEL